MSLHRCEMGSASTPASRAQHFEVMNERFKKVPYRGITSDELLALWREGKLYQAAEPTEDLAKRCQEEALSYVAAVNEFVAPEWLPYINDVWRAILSADEFSDVLIMHKGRMRGHMNRYVVTSIVSHLKEMNVYQCDSLLALHKKLEGVKVKNGIYKGAVVYGLKPEQRQKIRELRKFFVVKNNKDFCPEQKV